MQRIILAQILKFVGNFVVFSFLSGSHIGSCFCWLYKRILKSKCRGEGRGRGGGGQTWSGTEKWCSHNRQSGHLAWWSADNCGIFPIVRSLSPCHSKYFSSEKRTWRGNNSIKIENNTMPLYFFRISYLSFGQKLQNASDSPLQSCKFLLDWPQLWIEFIS